VTGVQTCALPICQKPNDSISFCSGELVHITPNGTFLAFIRDKHPKPGGFGEEGV
jgi:hypothetical protein